MSLGLSQQMLQTSDAGWVGVAAGAGAGSGATAVRNQDETRSALTISSPTTHVSNTDFFHNQTFV